MIVNPVYISDVAQVLSANKDYVLGQLLKNFAWVVIKNIIL